MTPALSDQERQRNRREAIKSQGLKTIHVRGKDGEFDERIRIAAAIKSLADRQALPHEILELIIREAMVSFPDQDQIKKKFVRKMLTDYLSNGEFTNAK